MKDRLKFKLKLAFWNINKHSINDYLTDLVLSKELDVLALLEHSGDKEDLEALLVSLQGHYRIINNPACERVIWLLKRSISFEYGPQSTYYSFLIINDLILCALHMPSNLFEGDYDRSNIALEIINKLSVLEERLATSKTIIMGDFNEDPYDSNCLGAYHFHGIPIANKALKESRVVNGIRYKMFYNPMWNYFGDNTSPPGTYYHSGTGAKEPFWHIYDQVLLRPKLVDSFSFDNLEVLTQINSNDLLTRRGNPKHKISDHLPVSLEIEV